MYRTTIAHCIALSTIMFEIKHFFAFEKAIFFCFWESGVISDQQKHSTHAVCKTNTKH